jgi:HSP20 family protein
MYESLLNYPGGLFAELERMRHEMDAVFGAGTNGRGIRAVGGNAFPALNVGHSPQSVDIYAFAPGLDASKTEVTLDRGVLTIVGERRSDLPGEKDKVSLYGHERFAGNFRRAVSLPDDVDPGQVNASYRDGVLHVSVRRRETMQPKRITIE